MKREAMIILGLIAVTLTAFYGLGQCGFVNFDDPGYVINSPHVTRGLSTSNFAWAWKTFYQGNYIPLTWLSLMLDATLFGPAARAFHWVNLAFHVANVVLIYLFFRHAIGAVWRSALVAAIFAVHPLRVESVAWIVERKDVLSGFFCLLTMLAYLRYVRALNRTWYAATLLLFAATLLAKQTLSTLPFILLLLDCWPLRRWSAWSDTAAPRDLPQRSLPQLIIEKLPLLLMAVAILLVTIQAQATNNSIRDFQAVSLANRLGNVPVSYARYLGKMVWFGRLLVLYPHHQWTAAQIAGAILLLLAITATCLLKWRSSPWLMVGWLWFLGALVPMIGVVQFGPQAMADRFTYISGVGLLCMAAWSIPAKACRQPVLCVTAVGTVLSLLVVFTIQQIGYWHDSVALFTHAVKVDDSPTAELNLGAALFERGKLSAAIAHLREAVNLDPQKAKAQADLAIALARDNRLAEALPHSRAAAKCEPNNAKWHRELAHLLLDNGQFEEAANECRTAIVLDPQSGESHRLLGLAYYRAGNRRGAIDELKRAILIEPELNEAKIDLKKFCDQM